MKIIEHYHWKTQYHSGYFNSDLNLKQARKKLQNIMTMKIRKFEKAE